MVIFNAWNSILDSFDQLKKIPFSILSLFGSTYSCEPAFCMHESDKSKLRNRLTDNNLESCLKLKTTACEPDLV